MVCKSKNLWSIEKKKAPPSSTRYMQMNNAMIEPKNTTAMQTERNQE
jgi:hypothetical protein